MLILPALLLAYLYAIATIFIVLSGTFAPDWHNYHAGLPQILMLMGLFLCALVGGYLVGKTHQP